MIIYQSTKEQFINEVQSSSIDQILLSFYFKATHRNVGQSEQSSWKKSLRYMRDVLNDPEIPADAGVLIEYQIPSTSKRIDFILTGQNSENIDHAVLIELKQWSESRLTEKDAIVRMSPFGEVLHPSYQVWSYADLLQQYSEPVYTENIQLKPCAYLHNYILDDVIKNSFYAEYLEKAPVFLEGIDEMAKLREFIKTFVKQGDKTNVMYRIENGKMRPSKALSDSLVKMLQGNREFVMIDDQKIAFETAMSFIKTATVTDKTVLIVRGGPGTGKSVVAINLLVSASKKGFTAHYVTRNAAPRDVYQSLLSGTMKKTAIANLFHGSGAYVDVAANTVDVLIVDEAHRLNEKSGIFRNKGENQIKEIINAAKCSVFFIDEDQKVTWQDIGEKEEIEKWAAELGVTVHFLELNTQFRCSGSDGYLAWLDDALQIRETANTQLEKGEYDFQIMDSPSALRDIIFEKNKEKNRARLVAGYCWDWVSKKNNAVKDIVFPGTDFAMKWNLEDDGSLWILSPESVNEVGCIHTCQGLETDYIGVIVGPDFVVREGVVITDPTKRSKMDSSIKGYKAEYKQHPEAARKKADAIIKNTYRTLMTRGMKGCYVYFTDKETEAYFRSRLGE